jgi:hypothetical protein
VKNPKVVRRIGAFRFAARLRTPATVARDRNRIFAPRSTQLNEWPME